MTNVTVVPVKPELTAVQLVPLLVERKTPLEVPAKRLSARDGKGKDISIGQANLCQRTVVG
ncbi:MAG: hypothetical protein MZV64_69595 [Ignavibacteriales bacterium]|nr:hypothetical protein [Ignavibacteriales bacterium]